MEQMKDAITRTTMALFHPAPNGPIPIPILRAPYLLRKMLGSLLMTIYFFGVLFGSMVWGYFADRFGRWNTHSLCHVMALIFGAASLLSPTIYILILLRFLSAFNSSGYQVLYTTQIEILGAKYRTFSSTANHFGWGFGIMMLAFIGVNTRHWFDIAAICPLLLLISLPWMFVMPESIRWLKVNGKYKAARKEIKRAAKLNRIQHTDECLESKIDRYLRGQRLSQQTSHKAGMASLFKHPSFLLNLVTLWSALLFNNFIYLIRTMHFSMDKLSIFSNFIVTGLSEWVCLAVSVAFMVIFKRKTCLVFFICITGLSCLVEHPLLQLPDNSLIFVSALDFVAKVSCTSGTIILFLVAYEVFPTELRNCGASIIMTALGISGILAPFSPHIAQWVGDQFNYKIILTTVAFILTICLHFLVTETKDVDVTDTIEESTKQSGKAPVHIATENR